MDFCGILFNFYKDYANPSFLSVSAGMALGAGVFKATHLQEAKLLKNGT